MTLFSIVTPVFNGARFLDETILSVLGQAGAFRLRYHIQDGGSTDGTLVKLAAWKERLAGAFPVLCQGIEFSYATGPDGGLYDAIARGFSATGAGDVMTWLNADDRLEPGALQSVGHILEKFPDIDWLGGRSTIADETGLIVISWPIMPFPRKAIAAGIFDGRFAPIFIQQEGVFWRAGLWQAAGGMNGRFRLAGDFDLWRRFARHSDLVVADTILGCWRRREGQLSANKTEYYAEIDHSLSAEETAARETVAAEYRKARGMNRLKRHGFTYRIASRPALTDWTCEEIDVVAPVTSISGPSYPVPTNWLARQAHRAVIRLRRLMG
jgi:glycosyltransferase involved in cell wall biosynthesis